MTEVQIQEDAPGAPGEIQPAWDHELELGNDLRAEGRLVWKEILAVLLIVAVAAVRIFLV